MGISRLENVKKIAENIDENFNEICDLLRFFLSFTFNYLNNVLYQK
jgi:hypothetical protein